MNDRRRLEPITDRRPIKTVFGELPAPRPVARILTPSRPRVIVPAGGSCAPPRSEPRFKDSLAGSRRDSRASSTEPTASIEDEKTATVTERHRRSLRAARVFFQLKARAPELQLLPRWLDSWSGLGLIVVGMQRQGSRLAWATT
jgi:hypothetical protein